MIRKQIEIKRLFAELSEKSKQICGDDSLKECLYLELLKKAGVETYKIPIPQRKLESFRKKTKLTAFKVIQENVIVNNQLYAVIETTDTGLSDLTADQISKIRKGEKIS